MLENAISQIVMAVQPELIFLLVQSAIIIFFIILIKNILSNIVYYIFFRMNERIAIGASVKINNDEYIIKKIGFFKIELENHDGFLQIPMSRWTYSNFKIMKNKEK